MGERWKNPPVFYTIAQLKFNPILRMEKYVPAIQDRLRRQGFPEFQSANDSHFVFDIDREELIRQRTSRWIFSDKKRTHAYVLSNDSIAFHTTSYVDFEQFSTDILKGLQAVHDEVILSSVVRIGLRYLDAIVPTKGHSVEDYLIKELHTFAGLEGHFKHRFLENVLQIDNRLLISKIFVVEKGLPLPPDLHPLPLSLPEKLRGRTGKTATLDNDCSSSEVLELESGLDREFIAQNLRTLKVCLNEAFEYATTDLARKEWM